MNDFLNTTSPIAKSFCVRTRRFIQRKLLQNQDRLTGNLIQHPITKHYQDKISNIFTKSDKQNLPKEIDELLETYARLVKKIDLSDEQNQKLIFEQIMSFLEYFFDNILNIKYLMNSLTKNSLSNYCNKSIGEQVDSIIPHDEKGDDKGNYGCCRHISTLLKHFFDSLEDIGLKTSNYLFIEKCYGSNHAGLIVTFQGKNYLLDPSISHNFNQPIENMGEKISSRMGTLANLSVSEIDDDITNTLNEYTKRGDNFHKVGVKNVGDLITLLTLNPDKTGLILLNRINLLDTLIGYVRVKFFSNGIQVGNLFFYYFDKKFSEDELNKIEDENLIDELLRHISYKTSVKQNAGQKIKVFNFEKEYIKQKLNDLSDKIDFSTLRGILSGNGSF